MYTLNCQVSEPQDSMKPSASCAQPLPAMVVPTPERSRLRVFCVLRSSAARRWLDCRYPITRASHSGERGLGLERGGEIVWAVRCDGMAPESMRHKRTVFGYGKAVLCSEIHQKAYIRGQV